MASSSIGVNLAPGVRVVEFDPRRPIEIGNLGVVGYVGPLQRGSLDESETVGDLIGPIDGPTAFERRCGGRISEDDLPEICQEFFEYGGNRMYLVRVADGTQEYGDIYLLNRRATAQRALRVRAHNAGRWAGRRRTLAGNNYDDDTLIAGALFDTEIATPADAWVGATLAATMEVTGGAQTTYSWEITGSTAAGILSTYADRSFTDDLSIVATTWQPHGLEDTTGVAALNVADLAGGAILADVCTRANLLKAQYNAHIARVTEIHKVADAANAVVAVDANDQASLDTLLNELKADYNLHAVDTTYHTVVDADLVTAPDPAGVLADSITLANDILEQLQDHIAAYSNVSWSLVLENDENRLSVEVQDGGNDQDNEFGLAVRLNGDIVKSWADLSMDSTSGRYAPTIVNNDPTNWYIRIANQWSGQATADVRPANYHSRVSAMTAISITTWPVRYRVSTGDANGTVGGWAFGASFVRDRLTLTFTGAGDFTVSSEAFGTLAAGEVGTAYHTHDARGSLGAYGITFYVTQGTTPFEADDVITLDVEPMEVNNGGLTAHGSAKVYPDTSNSPRVAVSVKSNTRTVITGKAAEDYTTVGDAPTQPTVTGTNVGAGATYTFDTTGGNNVLEVISDRGAEQTVSLTVNAALPLATIIQEINAGISGVTASAGTGGDAGKLVLTGDRGGYLAFLRTQDGTVNAIVGFTDDTEYAASTSGSYVRLQAPYEFKGGSDGLNGLATAMFEDAFDTQAGAAGSPFNGIEGSNEGLVKLATPSRTTVAIQQAGRAYAKIRHYQFRVEIPTTVTGAGQDAADWIDLTFGRTDGMWCKTSYPSSAYVPHKDGDPGSRKLLSLTGRIHGREAKIARGHRGYHKAEAGTEAGLGDILALGDTDAGRVIPQDVDLELLTPKGINGLRRIGTTYYLWGTRTLSTDPNWKWANQREQLSHYERILLESFDWSVFEINDAELWEQINAQLTDFFEEEHRKRALKGARFGDACTIRTDEEVNTEDTVDDGEVHAEVGLALARVAEKVIIGISKEGVATRLGT